MKEILVTIITCKHTKSREYKNIIIILFPGSSVYDQENRYLEEGARRYDVGRAQSSGAQYFNESYFDSSRGGSQDSFRDKNIDPDLGYVRTRQNDLGKIILVKNSFSKIIYHSNFCIISFF